MAGGAYSAPQKHSEVLGVQDATWYGVSLGPGDIMLDGDPAPPPPKGYRQAPLFGPSLLWPNGWMDQDAIWYEGIGLGPGDIVLDGDPSPH